MPRGCLCSCAATWAQSHCLMGCGTAFHGPGAEHSPPKPCSSAQLDLPCRGHTGTVPSVSPQRENARGASQGHRVTLIFAWDTHRIYGENPNQHDTLRMSLSLGCGFTSAPTGTVGIPGWSHSFSLGVFLEEIPPWHSLS